MTEEAKKPGRPGKVKCIVLRKIGTEDGKGMAEVGEEVSLSRDAAKRLQDAGAVKVAL